MQDLTPDSQQRNSIAIAIYAVALLVFLAAVIVQCARRKTLAFEFGHPKIAAQWELLGAEHSKVSEDGLSIDCRNTCVFLSPEPDKITYLGRTTLSWQEYPYVHLRISPVERERTVEFIWNPHHDLKKSVHFPVKIPAGASNITINTQNERGWFRLGPLKGPVIQFGFQFSNAIEIQSVTLSSFPSLTEWIPQLLDEYRQTEKFFPYIINSLYGIDIAGRPLVVYLGGVTLAMTLFWFFYPASVTRWGFLTGCVAAWMLFDSQFNQTLLKYLNDSLKHSAWQGSLEEERVARMGRDFADLAKVLDQTVPAGAKVFFPRDKKRWAEGVTPWAWFHFYPRYPQTSLQEADYIFYYYPAGYVYDARHSRFLLRKGEGKGVDVVVVREVGAEAKILKVRHA